jgi:hypothetical protein
MAGEQQALVSDPSSFFSCSNYQSMQKQMLVNAKGTTRQYKISYQPKHQGMTSSYRPIQRNQL